MIELHGTVKDIAWIIRNLNKPVRVSCFLLIKLLTLILVIEQVFGVARDLKF
jgi:hypothetical protein